MTLDCSMTVGLESSSLVIKGSKWMFLKNGKRKPKDGAREGRREGGRGKGEKEGGRERKKEG